MTMLLETRGLCKSFKGLTANDDINFSIEPATVRCVIGPNGAGKTTFLSLVSGHERPTAGRIVYKGEDVTRVSVVGRARLGIARKFQTPSVFHNLSVYGNIELAVFCSDTPRPQRDRRIHEVLRLVRLDTHAGTAVQFLSHGQRQWLEIGLLIAMQAQLFLLDEPAAGMTAEETAATAALIHQLVRELGVAVIVIEHDMNFIRRLSAAVTVLHLGRVLAAGSFEEIAADHQVRDVYLGSQI